MNAICCIVLLHANLHENSNPSQPYRIAMRVLSLSSCSQEYSDNFRLLKHVEACGICEIPDSIVRPNTENIIVYNMSDLVNS